MVRTLTPAELEARRREYFDKWLRIGFSAEETDTDQAEYGIRQLYQQAGLREPKIVWCASPAELTLARGFTMMTEPEAAGAGVFDRTVDAFDVLVRRAITRRTESVEILMDCANSIDQQQWTLLEVICNRLTGQLSDSLARYAEIVLLECFDECESAEGNRPPWERQFPKPDVFVRRLQSVMSESCSLTWSTENTKQMLKMLAQKDTGGGVALNKYVRQTATGDICGGQFGALKLFSYAFVREVHELYEETRLKEPELLIAKSAGMFVAHKRICWISRRPRVFKYDEGHRAHCADGPALEFEDGFGYYAWHGAVVPEWVILNPELITLEQIDNESNLEVQRVLLDRFGVGRYLTESKAELVQQDDFGKLYRRAVPGDDDLVVVRVVNCSPEPDGSYKEYFLRVPPEITTAQQAVAWTFGVEPNSYFPDRET